ncbi:MAG: DUF896 domain-containing protein [Pygmaiobacter sp.]|jgi:uncharacterized protein YnzC (UPF0291/DUF896 family)|nr:DUF896 domain-containing protein [Pygmaiobacter sp.]
MTPEKIKRINELAKKAREQGLTQQEKAEQAALRQEYVQAMKTNLKAQLDNMEVIDEYGNHTKIAPKQGKPGKPS